MLDTKNNKLSLDLHNKMITMIWNRVEAIWLKEIMKIEVPKCLMICNQMLPISEKVVVMTIWSHKQLTLAKVMEIKTFLTICNPAVPTWELVVEMMICNPTLLTLLKVEVTTCSLMLHICKVVSKPKNMKMKTVMKW